MQAPPFPFTLIIPAFNRAQGVAGALDSLLQQEVQPTEVIIVDDGSTPSLSAEALQRPGLAVRLVTHAANRGPSAARNSGMREARTRWVTFLDSDDRLAPFTLHQRVEALAARESGDAPSRVIYGCGWTDVDPSGRRLSDRVPLPAPESALFATGCWFAPGSCIFIDRLTAIETAGYQDEAIRRFEDFDWFLRLGLAGFTLDVLPVLGARIERRRSQNPEAMKAVIAAIREKWAGRPEVADLKESIRAYLELELASASWFAGRPAATLVHLAKSFHARPRLRLHLSPGWE